MRAVVTVTGKDKIGIIAKVSSFLAERGVNVEDISQTLLQDYFAMIMLVDISDLKMELSELAKECEELGRQIGMSIRMQHEAIFNAMHNI
ncbi:MAG: ACT domain-containing protein [Bacillota bacterium]|nr:MAG: ACT domain-containing protein [Bacillota bacterium]